MAKNADSWFYDNASNHAKHFIKYTMPSKLYFLALPNQRPVYTKYKKWSFRLEKSVSSMNYKASVDNATMWTGYLAMSPAGTVRWVQVRSFPLMIARKEHVSRKRLALELHQFANI